MNLRHIKRNSHLQNQQQNLTPMLGLLSPTAVLTCNVHPSQHQFNIQFQHPLQIINSLTLKYIKQAFETIVQATFQIKIEHKTIFVPDALLSGNYQIIHEYKKMIQRSRIGSYIKLNMKHEEKSYQKKRPASFDTRAKIKEPQTARNMILSKVFNQKNVNQKVTRITNQHLTVNKKINYHQSSQDQKLTPLKKDRSFTVQKISSLNKANQENINVRFGIEERKQICTVINHTHIHKATKSKSTKKGQNIKGIKINYIAIKGSNQNPQTSTFIYKSSATHTNRQLSDFGPKTQLLSPHIIHFDKTIDNDISFSVNNQNEKFSVHSQFKQGDDNLSEHFERSLKNSQMSQLTHNELHTNNYFFNDRKILKKGRKSVFVENFQKREVL